MKLRTILGAVLGLALALLVLFNVYKQVEMLTDPCRTWGSNEIIIDHNRCPSGQRGGPNAWSAWQYAAAVTAGDAWGLASAALLLGLFPRWRHRRKLGYVLVSVWLFMITVGFISMLGFRLG